MLIILNRIIKYLVDHWQPIIALSGVFISILAFIVSIYTIWQSRKESILLNRAYVNVVSWDTTDSNDQFLFSFANFGNTPANNFEVISRLFISGEIKEKTLAKNNMILPGLPSDRIPKVGLNVTLEEIGEILSSQDKKIQIEFKYNDYVGKLHIGRADFMLHDLDGKYQLTLVSQNFSE